MSPVSITQTLVPLLPTPKVSIRTTTINAVPLICVWFSKWGYSHWFLMAQTIFSWHYPSNKTWLLFLSHRQWSHLSHLLYQWIHVHSRFNAWSPTNSCRIHPSSSCCPRKVDILSLVKEKIVQFPKWQHPVFTSTFVGIPRSRKFNPKFDNVLHSKALRPKFRCELSCRYKTSACFCSSLNTFFGWYIQ